MKQAAKTSSLQQMLALLIASILFIGFIALGIWQVNRLTWKLDLIERVNQRVSAKPIAPPAKAQWMQVGVNDEYRHVCLSGEYLHDRETYVQAVTKRGPGFWLLTPMQSADGNIVLINRGLITAAQKSPTSRDQAQLGGTVKVCGLLRLSEPSGGFLRKNDPVQARWYSRDVLAIAATQYLPIQSVAPYFIDADASPNPGGVPVGGLTVIRFHNSHLVYALTWFGMALLTLVGAGIVIRHQRRL